MIDLMLAEGLKELGSKSALGELAKNTPLESLSTLNEPIDNVYGLYAKEASAEGLTAKEKNDIGKETGWPDSILDNIRTSDEAEVYKKANLEVEKVGDKDCLVKTDIDYEKKDEFGRTNLERMKQGLAPLDENGNSYELHHIGQKTDSPLAELTREEHRGTDNDMVLHDKTQDSAIDRYAFREERQKYWQERAKNVETKQNQNGNN